MISMLRSQMVSAVAKNICCCFELMRDNSPLEVLFHSLQVFFVKGSRACKQSTLPPAPGHCADLVFTFLKKFVVI